MEISRFSLQIQIVKWEMMSFILQTFSQNSEQNSCIFYYFCLFYFVTLSFFCLIDIPVQYANLHNDQGEHKFGEG